MGRNAMHKCRENRNLFQRIVSIQLLALPVPLCALCAADAPLRLLVDVGADQGLIALI